MRAASTNTPNLRHKPGNLVVPGDRIGDILIPRQKIQLISGKGTYARQGHLYASILGTLCVHHVDTAAGDASDDVTEGDVGEKWVVSITSEKSSKNNNICPTVGMIILGRVTRVVRPTHAMVDIIAIVPDNQKKKNNTDETESSTNSSPLIIPLHEPYAGTLRQSDIRPNSSLEIDVSDCIKPGDVILARIHASGGSGGGGGSGDSFVLTTAEAELGVIQAICEVSGCEMNPISWKEMECPVSGMKEGRKVAKPRGIKPV